MKLKPRAEKNHESGVKLSSEFSVIGLTGEARTVRLAELA